MKKILILLTLICSLQLSFSQSSPIKKDIKRLLHLTGSGELGVQVMDQLLDNYKDIYPDIPESFWEGVKEEVQPDDLINLVIPIYAKYYTHDEIKGLIKFYETPLGKKTIQTLPMITQESMTAGREWGIKIATKIAERLEEGEYSTK